MVLEMTRKQRPTEGMARAKVLRQLRALSTQAVRLGTGVRAEGERGLCWGPCGPGQECELKSGRSEGTCKFEARSGVIW